MMFHGDHDVSRISPYNDILDVVAQGKTIKRCVGLDESTVLLRGIYSAHCIERVNGLIQPWR